MHVSVLPIIFQNVLHQGTDTRLLCISRNFTHDVLNVCEEPKPSPWKQARKLTLKNMQLQTEFSKSSLRRKESTEGKLDLEEESSDVIVWDEANLLTRESLGQPVLIRIGMKTSALSQKSMQKFWSWSLMLTKIFKFLMLLR